MTMLDSIFRDALAGQPLKLALVRAYLEGCERAKADIEALRSQPVRVAL